MSKTELIEKVVKEVGLTKADATKALKTVLESIAASLKKGKTVTLVGFGTFKVSKRKARKGRNPRTGTEIKIPARKIARFTAGKTLRDAVR